MVRALVAVSLLAACHARPVPTRSARDSASSLEAVCRVTVTAPGDRGSNLVLRYDLQGRLLSGTLRPTPDGHGAETLRWRGAELEASSTVVFQAARRGDCDVVGGCDEPATRTFTRVALRRSGGWMRHIHVREDRYARWPGGTWRPRSPRIRTYRLAYEQGRLRTVHFTDAGTRGLIRFEHADGRVVRRTFTSGGYVFDSHFRWEEGRLVAASGTTGHHAFAYDATGRPRRWEHTSGDPSERVVAVEWRYDAEGRLAARVETSTPPVGRPAQRVERYEYDRGRRLARVLRDRAVRETYAYEGECSGVRNAPEVPDPLELAQGRFCFTSPGWLFHACL